MPLRRHIIHSLCFLQKALIFSILLVIFLKCSLLIAVEPCSLIKVACSKSPACNKRITSSRLALHSFTQCRQLIDVFFWPQIICI